MKRRKFILLSAAAAGAITLPLAGCKPAHSALRPGMLAELANDKALREIGLAYLQQYPAEQNRDVLTRLITPEISHRENDSLQTSINTNVLNDFRKGNTIIIKGWVLSLTEARQCALLTL